MLHYNNSYKFTVTSNSYNRITQDSKIQVIINKISSVQIAQGWINNVHIDDMVRNILYIY